jgi:NhaP-type Na+/H+ or K+/H+ antiporter
MITTAILWFLVIGGLFVTMAVSGSFVRRLPFTFALIYLLAGLALGPLGVGLLQVHPIQQAALIERLSEVAVIVSLFAAGLKLRMRLRHPAWWIPVRLAFVSMAITVGLIALAGVVGLGLPLGAAILLGAVLAPTDPVLASDVQVEHPLDRDRLRFGLTGEAGLNDGAAFPFVMLGLGLLGLHDLGAYGWRWLAVDVVWATVGGLGVGWLLGTLIGRLVIYLRHRHKEAHGLDDFLTIGLIALAYGAALLVFAYGFLAVFAAGLALRHIELRANQEQEPEAVEVSATVGDEEAVATDEQQAPAYMVQTMLGFNEQLERIGEVALVVLLGGMLAFVLPNLTAAVLWFIPLLFLVIRPVAVAVGLIGSATDPIQRSLMAWFGIRGIGTIYYLMYAIEHGLPAELVQPLTTITLATITASIVIHGISVTPLMRRYRREAEGETSRRGDKQKGRQGDSAQF